MFTDSLPGSTPTKGTMVSSLSYCNDMHGWLTPVDIVGNNIPVFFIQDAIKFPDLIHAVKPNPDSEIPQAATGHDTAWDFFSQQPSTMHTLLWAMSQNGVVRSYRHMDGFGVHVSLTSPPSEDLLMLKFTRQDISICHGRRKVEACQIQVPHAPRQSKSSLGRGPGDCWKERRFSSTGSFRVHREREIPRMGG
jgi:hypothetical protein